MPSFPTNPLVRSREDGLQLSYRLPHRIHAAKGYPLRAPNGSSIIIYGYDTGLKVIWRGGRHFSELKVPEPVAQQKNAANSGGDSVMIIDSDEEEAVEEPPIVQEPTYEFLGEETEVDPAFPFEAVLRQIDIPLGSRILDLAVPRVHPDAARSSLDPFPPIARNMIVVSAVCSDLSTRIVTIPIVPPHPAQTDFHSWEIQTVMINGGVTHQDIPRGVSLTFTCQDTEEEDHGKSRSRVGRSEKWDLLIATHSAEGSGVLLLHRIPIREDSSGKGTVYRLSEEDIVSQRRALAAPAQRIAFNPSTYPSIRHSNLLVAFHSGCVKVYSCFSVQKLSKTARRASIPQEPHDTVDSEGRWLISLYPGFEQGSTGLTRRKTIVDADWVLGGRAIMILLEDGEWGVWDIEGAGPGTAKGPLHRQSSVQGVTGGSLTTYAVSGRIVAPPTNTQSDAEHRPRFAPMTPSTKRVREDTLLKGSMNAASPSLRGQISVLQTNSLSDTLPDESILVRHGRHSAVIPSLLSLWRNAVRATGTFDASNRCRVTPFQDVNLMGENFQAIGHLPAPVRGSRAAESQPFDVLVAAEHHIMIIAPRLAESEEGTAAVAHAIKQETAAEADQMMLQRGELDVEGMGRLLNGMANGTGALRMGSPVKRTRIFT
ncbi:hypothetical protein N7462_001554 [Penicillium macrosclerotiorum]|uniref:uncharacterized protein n=1 Tax=Penicillium macrosclerotiorum TaxID=303699 RepID=UPI002547C84F|nr:uncharacterized protein N7462_001554 [Penicillium macrosclerotiorum]KAJ5692131.1 hypothetical protein N7462_001554 [Penicillium macrosclerotiorum]